MMLGGALSTPEAGLEPTMGTDDRLRLGGGKFGGGIPGGRINRGGGMPAHKRIRLINKPVYGSLGITE